MSDYINEALLGASPYKDQRKEATKLVSKWERTGLLDGIEGDFERGGMAQLLENQARELIKEASSTSPTQPGRALMHIKAMKNGQVLHFH